MLAAVKPSVAAASEAKDNWQGGAPRIDESSAAESSGDRGDGSNSGNTAMVVRCNCGALDWRRAAMGERCNGSAL